MNAKIKAAQDALDQFYDGVHSNYGTGVRLSNEDSYEAIRLRVDLQHEKLKEFQEGLTLINPGAADRLRGILDAPLAPHK